MTPFGFEKIQDQLRRYKEEDLARLEKALGEAREKGDLSENAEFDAAREGIWQVEQQIAELEDIVTRAEVIDISQLPKDRAAIGATVKVKDLDSGATDEFRLVGAFEAKFYGDDAVSVMAPLGEALCGLKVGEKAECRAPRGMIRYQILGIRYA